MSLTGEIFLPFLLVLFIVYYAVPLKARTYVLLSGSLLFYLSWGFEKLLITLAAVAAAWLCGLLIGKKQHAAEAALKEAQENAAEAKARQAEEEKAAAAVRSPEEKAGEAAGKKEKAAQAAAKKEIAAKKAAVRTAGKKQMWAGIVLLVIFLVWSRQGTKIQKMLNFENPLTVLIPLGVSYYTLMLISYLVDVQHRKVEAEHNYLQLLSYATYFPGILQGPFSRYGQLSPQLKEGHRFNYTKVCFGAQLMLYGFFKKLVIADRLAQFTGTVFAKNSLSSRAGSVLFVGLIFRALQLYCDFSGYMDIAGGVSELFGIDLAKNFNHPFFSRSAAEFWRRWHITLGTWFKDYVYMPLNGAKWVTSAAKVFKKHFGRKAGMIFMKFIPLYIVWILTGLWHGTGWDYVLWGLYWGTLIFLSEVLAPQIRSLNKKLHINTEAPSWKVFQMVRTFFLFVIGRLITLDGSKIVIRQMVKSPRLGRLFDGTLLTMGLDGPNFTLAAAALCFVWLISIQQEKGSVREKIASFNIVFRWIIYIGAVLVVVIYGVYGMSYDASSFIYMQF